MKRERVIKARRRIGEISAVIGLPLGGLTAYSIQPTYGTGGLAIMAGFMLAGWIVSFVIIGIAWVLVNHND